MPMPTTARWPKPKSEDEFEDIAVDFLRIRWKDPHAARNGRRGQRQNGVDIVGHPSWTRGKIAGAQCKNTDSLNLTVVRNEIEQAKGFPGGLGEFLIVTSTDRDSSLQAEVRELCKDLQLPFHVESLFWPDVTADLCGNHELVAKHWKGFSSFDVNRGLAVPPPFWIGREGVRDDETCDYRCELALWIPNDPQDLDASELVGGLEASADANLRGPFIAELLKHTPVQLGRQLKWSFSMRDYANVVRKWELEVGANGFLAFRWAHFTTGASRFFDTYHLAHGVFHPIKTHRFALKHMMAKVAGPGIPEVVARLAVHGSLPLLLNGELHETLATGYVGQVLQFRSAHGLRLPGS